MAREHQNNADRIVESWRKAAPGWQQWEPHIVAFSWPVTNWLVDALHLSPGDRVLDVGAGIGDPSLAIAAKIAPGGNVLAIDPVAEMIQTAGSRAEGLRLSTIEFRVAAIDDLELPAGSLDAVCGRWSFIFCPDILAALTNARRWLRSGGRIALSTWTPLEDNPGFKILNEALNRQIDLPPIDSAKPGMSHLCEPGQIERALKGAGFDEVHVEQLPLSFFSRCGQEYWSMMCDMGSGLRSVIESLAPEQLQAVRRDVIEGVETFRCNSVLRIPALAQVARAVA